MKWLLPILLFVIVSDSYAVRRRTLSCEVAGKTDATNVTHALHLPDGGWITASNRPEIFGSHTGNLSYGFRGNADNTGNILESISGEASYSPTFPMHSGGFFYFPSGTSNNPTADVIIYQFTNNAGDVLSIIWTKTGYLAGARLFTKFDSVAITTDVWMAIAVTTDWGNPTAHDTIVIDNRTTKKVMTSATAHTGSSANMNTYIGWNAASGNGTGTSSYFRVDDWMENDASGSFETGMPDTSATMGIVFMPLNTDSSRGNWVGGAGGTTNLASTAFTLEVKGATSESNSTNIKNLTASTSEKYFGSTSSYNSILPGGKVIKVTWAMVRTGEDATTGTAAGNIQLYTNPTDGGAVSFNFGNDLTAHLNENIAFRDADNLNNWYTVLGAYVYSPTVVSANGATVMIEKTTNSTKQACVDQAGIFVQYGASSNSSTIFNTSEQ